MTRRRLPRVLVADDDATVARTTAAVLQHLGATTAIASTGEEAVALATALPAIAEGDGPPFDIILMDVRMRGVGGPAAAEQILAHHRGSELQIVGVTGDRASVLEDCVRAGMVEVFEKPMRVPDYERVLRRARRADR